jgi:hypothetical protein
MKTHVEAKIFWRHKSRLRKDTLEHFDIKRTQRYLHVKENLLINIESTIDGLYRAKWQHIKQYLYTYIKSLI